MGTFRIEIEAVGDHGDFRDEVKDGDTLLVSDSPHSVDAVAAQAAAELRARGAMVTSAKLIHWPGQESEVVDDFVTGTRHGAFR